MRIPHATRPRTSRSPSPNTRGFTLLEMALALVVIGVLIAVGAYSVPWLNERLIMDRSRLVMEETRQALVAFARTHHRLPCPATGANGNEDCGADSGTVPYNTLLLPDPVLDAHHRPISYAVYRNNAAPALDADLARLINRIDDFDNPDSTLNACDFCEAIKNAVPAAANSALASTSTRFTGDGGCAAGEVNNQAFVLMSSGLEDRDGSGSPTDEDNADANANCFSSTRRGRDDSHDDIVIAMGFTALIGEVCH